MEHPGPVLSSGSICPVWSWLAERVGCCGRPLVPRLSLKGLVVPQGCTSTSPER